MGVMYSLDNTKFNLHCRMYAKYDEYVVCLSAGQKSCLIVWLMFSVVCCVSKA